MNYEGLSTASWNAAGAAAFLVALHLAHGSLRAGFRFKLFELRRELFSMMIDGQIDQGNVSYIQLRQVLNGMLALAEGLSGAQALFLIFASRRLTGEKMIDVLRQVPAGDVRERLLSIHARLSKAILLHLLWNPFVLLLFALLMLLAIVKGVSNAILSAEDVVVRGVESKAQQVGDPELRRPLAA